MPVAIIDPHRRAQRLRGRAPRPFRHGSYRLTVFHADTARAPKHRGHILGAREASRGLEPRLPAERSRITVARRIDRDGRARAVEAAAARLVDGPRVSARRAGIAIAQLNLTGGTIPVRADRTIIHDARGPRRFVQGPPHDRRIRRYRLTVRGAGTIRAIRGKRVHRPPPLQQARASRQVARPQQPTPGAAPHGLSCHWLDAGRNRLHYPPTSSMLLSFMPLSAMKSDLRQSLD